MYLSISIFQEIILLFAMILGFKNP